MYLCSIHGVCKPTYKLGGHIVETIGMCEIHPETCQFNVIYS